MKTLTTEQIKEMRDHHERFAFINVLPAEKFEATHINDSTNIPVDNADFVKKVEKQVGGKDQKVVVYCASEECNASATAAEKLEKAGFKQVFRYTGGAKAWHESDERLHAHTRA
jgi:rhodanese-related sulfurtransferase